MPRATGNHRRQYETRGQEDAAKIRIQDRIVICIRELRNLSEDSDTGGIHQDIDRPDSSCRFLEKLVHILSIANVRRNDAGHRADLLRCGFQLRSAPGGQRNPGSHPAQFDGNRPANSPAGSCDDSNLAFNCGHKPVLRSPDPCTAAGKVCSTAHAAPAVPGESPSRALGLCASPGF